MIGLLASCTSVAGRAVWWALNACLYMGFVPNALGNDILWCTVPTTAGERPLAAVAHSVSCFTGTLSPCNRQNCNWPVMASGDVP